MAAYLEIPNKCVYRLMWCSCELSVLKIKLDRISFLTEDVATACLILAVLPVVSIFEDCSRYWRHCLSDIPLVACTGEWWWKLRMDCRKVRSSVLISSRLSVYCLWSGADVRSDWYVRFRVANHVARKWFRYIRRWVTWVIISYGVSIIWRRRDPICILFSAYSISDGGNLGTRGTKRDVRRAC